MGEDLCGAEEFVLDSYKIREGKLAILEMEGVCLKEAEGLGTSGTVAVTGLPTLSIDGEMSLFDILKNLSFETISLLNSNLLRKGEAVAIDFAKVLNGEEDLALQDGDALVLSTEIPSGYIIGRDGYQKEVFFKEGSIPLRRALFECESLPSMTDNPVIQVVRAGMPKPKVYSLDWEHVCLLPETSLLLMRGDIVYVTSNLDSKLHRLKLALLPKRN